MSLVLTARQAIILLAFLVLATLPALAYNGIEEIGRAHV